MPGTGDQEFVAAMRSVLERQDPQLLLDYLDSHVSMEELSRHLASGDQDAVKIALFCLGWVGTMEQVPEIAAHLQAEDEMTVGLAEHTLWSIWFRAGDPGANTDLKRVVQLIDEGKLDTAIAEAGEVVHRCPGFAEAYNQRAIGRFLKGDYVSAIDDCQETLVRNPHHFGALAGLGHCYALLGELEPALSAYRRALRLYPHMEGVRESIQHIRRCLAQNRESDSFPFTPA
jgi:tetratricopeptide (TPR) repeat protein